MTVYPASLSAHALRNLALLRGGAIAVMMALIAAGCGDSQEAARSTGPGPSSSATPDIGVYFPTPTPGQHDSSQLVRQKVRAKVSKQLDRAQIAFNVPTKVRVKDTATIQLLLSFTHTVDELRRQLEEIGLREGAVIQASNVIIAELKGRDFAVEPITKTQQLVGANDPTEWKWEVEPRKAGRRRLHLTLTAIVGIGGRNTNLSIRTFDRTLEVTGLPARPPADKPGWMSRNYQWLVTTIVALLALFPGGAIVRRLRSRTNVGTTPPAETDASPSVTGRPQPKAPTEAQGPRPRAPGAMANRSKRSGNTPRRVRGPRP